MVRTDDVGLIEEPGVLPATRPTQDQIEVSGLQWLNGQSFTSCGLLDVGEPLSKLTLKALHDEYAPVHSILMPSKRLIEYVASERFIHDELMRRAGVVIKKLPKMWNRDGHIQPSMILWPSDTVKTDDGKEVEDLVYARMPEEESERMGFLKGAIERAGPYALLVVEQRAQSVVAVFESHHGARAWTLPIERRGDRRALGEPEVQDNGECLGLLWRRNLASA